MQNNHDQFESHEIISMFPTFVWQTMIKEEVYQSLNKDIINKLNQLKTANPDLDRGGSWQSAGDLHKMTEFEALISLVKATTSSVLSFLKVGHEGFELTGCWANMNESGSSHKSHSHPNNFLSGVVVNIRNGMFLLFPSWLQHSVDANQSADTRISVSFNIMFSAYVDSMSKPLW